MPAGIDEPLDLTHVCGCVSCASSLLEVWCFPLMIKPLLRLCFLCLELTRGVMLCVDDQAAVVKMSMWLL